jgi:hypothetical protein
MPEETITEGLKQEMRGLKDPGNILIVVYILLVFLLLLFAGLESARADRGKADEGTFFMEKREISAQVRNAASLFDTLRPNGHQRD